LAFLHLAKRVRKRFVVAKSYSGLGKTLPEADRGLYPWRS
jgi:hypothetical protein